MVSNNDVKSTNLDDFRIFSAMRFFFRHEFLVQVLPIFVLTHIS